MPGRWRCWPILAEAIGRLVCLIAAVLPSPVIADWQLFPREVIEDPDPGRFSVCLDHSCHTILTRSVSAGEWARVREPLLAAAPTAAAERDAVAEAIARMEAIVGDKTGTSGDRGGNLDGFGQPGQMDCIDESTNTTTYLRLLQKDGLLRFHTVDARATRFGLFVGMPHTTAVLRETATGRRFAIDSWFHDNGRPPAVVELSAWRAGWRPGRDGRD